MNFRNLFLSVGAVSLLAGPAQIPVAGDAEARSIARPIPHPVNCSIFERREYDRRAYQRSGNLGRTQASPPPVSAPPPPPSSAPVAAEKAVITSTASKPVSTGRRVMPPRPPYPSPVLQDRERYDGKDVASIKRVADTPVSTFSVDVDTGSYSNVRRILNEGRTPPAAAVRTEEMVNYFRYDYPSPESRATPFSVTTDIATSPWNDASKLLRVGLRGYDIHASERPRANLVFLVDVSGSMRSQDKLPLVKSTLMGLADQLRKDDRVSIVVYSGRVGKLLTATNKKEHIKEAVDCLYASGSTAGGHALKTAYQTARSSFIKGGINRIVMATDGDFNVGTSGTDELKKMVEKERKSGVSLTMLGFGRGNIRDELMEGIANVGNGNYAYIDSAMEARKVLNDELSSTLFTIAKDVKIQIEFNPAYVSEYRLIGYENRLLAEEDFDDDKIDAGEIGAGHQVTAIYEIIPKGMKGWLPNRRYDGNKVTGKGKANGELGFVKLRYKLPNGSTSRLIKRPLASNMLARSSRPSGDMAFATAVAAFGQKLRGDKYLGDFGYGDIRSLAGSPRSYWRQEFVKLTELAESGS